MVWEPQNFAKHLISRCVGAGASIMLVEMERIFCLFCWKVWRDMDVLVSGVFLCEMLYAKKLG